jgi:hypothetical protein
MTVCGIKPAELAPFIQFCYAVGVMPIPDTRIPDTHRSPTLMVAALAVLTATVAHAACYDRVGGMQSRFVLKSDKAFDSRTGLTWQRCSVGLTWDGKHACIGDIAYLGLTEAKQAAAKIGTEWRVPTGPELESLIDPACGQPVADQEVFPDIRRGDEGEAEYWTTTPVGVAGLFYVFDFMTGAADGHSDGIDRAVRLVKGDFRKTPVKDR